MRRWRGVLIFAMLTAAPLHGQGLRDKISDLFIFGSGDEPLFLAGSADPDNPFFIQVHGAHFVPAAVESNGALIQVLTSAIGTSTGNIPISATSSGFTFRFDRGIPVRTSTSPGPIFAERAQTLGRGRVLVAANFNAFKFKSVRGVDLDNLSLNFAHENVDFPGCDAAFGGDCSILGVPDFENDVIALNLDMDIDVTALSFQLSYGLHDRIDIGVAVPVIFIDLRGTSRAQVVPFGGPTASHFFDGSTANPTLAATRFVEGSASGLGDVAARLKISLSESERTWFAIFGDARFPTGDEADLLGSGHLAIRGMGVVSATFGAFSPHANVGYLFRDSDIQSDALLATVGFDHMLAPWATLAVDLASELQVGDNKLLVPDPVVIEQPFRRTVSLSSIPNQRDDIVNGSIGLKFVTPSGLTLVTNSIWPLNSGGVRPHVLWTAGLEYNF